MPTSILFTRGFAVLWLCCFLLVSHPNQAQPTPNGCTGPVYNIKTCFGAQGDGTTNDQLAFESAAQFFNQLYSDPAYNQPTTLYIPAGTYIVGRQIFDPARTSADHLYQGIDVLKLVGCRNLTILGEDRASTAIVYNTQGMRYGSFDASGNAFEPTGYGTRDEAAWMGCCIALRGCQNVKIKNLKLDGNDSDITLGGHWGDTGIQLDYDGIQALSSKQVWIENVDISNFGRDGILCLDIVSGNPSGSDTQFYVLSSTSSHNGRQGLTLNGTNFSLITGTKFNHNGKVVTPSKTITTAPGAGVDIEPEGSYVLNTSFGSCEMIDNEGVGFIADRHGPGVDPNYPKTTRAINVNSSVIWGTKRYAAWVTQPEVWFNGSIFTGGFIWGCTATNAREATTFTQCEFNDNLYNGQENNEPFLVHSDARVANRMRFDNCRFVVTHKSFMYLDSHSPLIEDELTQFENCQFLYNQNQNVVPPFSQWRGVKFIGNTQFINTGTRTGYISPDMMFGGNSSAALTQFVGNGTVTYNATNNYQLYACDLAVGPTAGDAVAMSIFRNNTLVYGPSSAGVNTFTVGPNSSITVERGGALEILSGASVVLEGQIIVKDSAYLCVGPNVSFSGSGQFIVAPGAIIGKNPNPALRSNYSNDGCYLPQMPAIANRLAPMEEVSAAPTKGLLITPNPVANELQVHLTTDQQGIVEITDALGRVNKRIQVQGGTQSLRDLDLKAGIYYINFLDKNGKTLRSKFVKI